MLSDGPTAQDVYAQLYADHAGAVLTYLTNKLRDPDTAQDVASAAWENALRGLPRTLANGDGVNKSWVMRVATNAMYDHWRAVKARPQTSDLGAAVAPGSALPDTLTEQETPEWVALGVTARASTRASAALLLELLPRPYRLVLWLYEWRGNSYEQIAVALHCTAAAVKTRLWRARAAQVTLWERERHYRTSPAAGGGIERRLWGAVAGGRDWALAHPQDCWHWLGSRTGNGTDTISVHTHRPMLPGTHIVPRRTAIPRRLLWALLRGALPPWAAVSPCPHDGHCINPMHTTPSYRVGQGPRRYAIFQPCDPAIDEPGEVSRLVDGASLRERRRRLGITIARLAEESGQRAKSIGEIERGRPLPPPTILRIADALASLEARITPAERAAARIVERRRSHGLSLAGLARLANITRQTLDNLEHGRRSATHTTVRRVTDALDRLERERTQVSQGVAA